MRSKFALFLILILACTWLLAAADTVPDRNAAGKISDKLEQEKLLAQEQQEEANREAAEEEQAELQGEAPVDQFLIDKARMDELMDKEENEGELSEEEASELKTLGSKYYHDAPTGRPGGGAILVTGDDCTDPIVVDLDVVGLPWTDAGQTTCGRLNDYSTTCLGSYDGGEDIIYEIIVGTDGFYQFTLDPLGTTYSGMVIDDTCPAGGTGQCIAFVTGSSSAPRGFIVNLVAGTYYVMIDTWPSPTCIPLFDLTIDTWTPPPGDTCDDPIVIPESFPYSDAGNTCSATNACDITGTDNSDIIYQLTITSTIDLTVSLCNSSFDTKLAIFLTDCCTGAGTEWAYNDDNSAECTPGTRSEITTTFDPGTYYIVVDGYSTNCGDYQLDITEYIVPIGRCCYGDPVVCADNTESDCTGLGGIWSEGLNCTDNPCPGAEGNDCSDPVVVDLDAIVLPYVDAGQYTCGRLDDYNATCLGSYDGGEDIIYQVIVGTADYYMFTLDPLGTTYTGILLDDTCPPGGTGACIAYVGNSNSNPRVIPRYLEAGTYYVMVDKSTTGGTCISAFDLTIETYSPPANDECVNAEPVEVPSSTPGSTILANPDSAPTCGTTDGSGGGVWYSVIGTGNTITATLCDELTDFDTKMRVYCFDCGDLYCVGGNDDSSCPSGGLKSTVVWCSEAGTQYFILVHGFSANVGNFVLNMSDDGTPCEDPPVCAPPSGACCVDLVCVGTMYEIDCSNQDGYWYEGQDCDAGFECPVPRQVGLATTANIPDVGVSNFGPLGEYDTQDYTYDWNGQDPVNFAGTFVMGNSSTTMFSYYNAGITDCWEHTATDFLNMDDTFHPTAQYDDSGVLGGLTIDYCGHGFNIDNPPEEAGDIFVHVFTVTNNGAEAVDNYYAGVYYDWDIGGTDLITFDRDDNLIIQGPDETYNYGICLLNAGEVGLTSLAGVSQQDYIYPTTHPPGGWQMADLYNIMSSGTDQLWDAQFTDMSSLMSSGPHTINPGESITFKFAVIGGITTADIIADAQYALANLDIPNCGVTGGPCGHYVVGDYNGNETFNVADVIAAFSKLQTGAPDAFLLCECPPGGGNVWAVAFDVNNNCIFNVADVIAAFSRLQTGAPELVACDQCPPDPPPYPRGGDRPLVVPSLESKATIRIQSGSE